nr:PREDICTED: uncharacterized protein LOC108201232 [Daucus carota subsp. sativus]
MGTEPRQATCKLNFLVVKASSTYNAILGRTGIHVFKAIPSTYHLKIKFLTSNGIREEIGDQKMARSCYIGALKSGGTGATDMPGIDPLFMTHKLNVNPERKPIKQKKGNFAPERQEAIKQEVDKLLEAGFIEEIQFPEWLANPVMVKKANGKWKMCVDFTDLNDACPKDCFSLPRIDTLIDATAGHEMLSFMDGFSEDNQIRIYKDDVPKEQRTNVWQTRCPNMLIGKTMEVYVDDMLVKSLNKADHLEHLKEDFEVLRTHKMMLNPAKCAFGVGSGKFLGQMVSKRGIEAKPDKIKAILDMEPPKSVRDVQKLTGRITALGKFVSKSGDKCLPFFKALKKVKNFEWTDESQVAFEEPKKYMAEPPLLSKPIDGEVLYVYLAVSEQALSAVLVREELKIQKLVYYVSKVLHGAEFNYSVIEKFPLAMITASRKLRSYFQSHKIEVLTDQPLRNVIHSPKASGRLIKWSPDGFIVEYAIKLDFPTTNNEAEYEALIAGLGLARTLRVKNLKVCGDSKLVVFQVNGEFEAREETMLRYLRIVKTQMALFEECIVEYVPREENTKADALSQFASSDDEICSGSVYYQVMRTPSIEAKLVALIDTRATWMDEIKLYLENGHLPPNADEARKLQVRAFKYVIIEGILYRKSFVIPYLRCLRPDEAREALEEVHEGVCGQQLGGRALAHKVTRLGFYWARYA